MRDNYFGVRELKIADRQFLHSGAIDAFNQSTGPARAVSGKGGHPRARFHRYLRIDERVRRAGIQDETSCMSVECTVDVNVIICIYSYWDSRKSAAGQETCRTLAHCGTASVWVDVKHLPSAVDDHPELDHLARAENTIDVRQGFGIGNMRSRSRAAAVAVETGEICDPDGHVCHVAIAHCDAFYFARPKSFPAAAKQTADIRAAFFDSETKCIHTIDVDDGVRRPCVDHQGTAPIVDRDRNKQMVADPALSFRRGKTLFR